MAAAAEAGGDVPLGVSRPLQADRTARAAAHRLVCGDWQGYCEGMALLGRCAACFAVDARSGYFKGALPVGSCCCPRSLNLEFKLRKSSRYGSP